MNADSGVDLTALKVDGGMVANETLMQFQADILGVPVIRPVVAETTALGAAYAAGLAVGFWAGEEDIRANWAEDKRWEPQHGRRQAATSYYRKWKKAVTKTFDWVDETTTDPPGGARGCAAPGPVRRQRRYSQPRSQDERRGMTTGTRLVTALRG